MKELVEIKVAAFADETFVTRTGGVYTLLAFSETILFNEASNDRSKAPVNTLSLTAMFNAGGGNDSERLNVRKEVRRLCDIVFSYNGEIHQSNFLTLCWGGDQVFKGLLTRLDVTQSKFAPDGEPLRAEASLHFAACTGIDGPLRRLPIDFKE